MYVVDKRLCLLPIHLCIDKQIPLPEVSPDRLSLFILAEIVVSDITLDSYFFQHCKIKNHHIAYYTIPIFEQG